LISTAHLCSFTRREKILGEVFLALYNEQNMDIRFWCQGFNETLLLQHTE